MTETTVTIPNTSPVTLQGRSCPQCGMPEAAVLAVLPSGTRALVEACAVCGRRQAAPVTVQQACALLEA